MQRVEVVKRTLYYSAIDPKLVTDSPELGRTIDWADANPVVWKIVRGTRSKPFGKNSSTYMGCQRGDSPSSTISRAATFLREVEREGDEFFGWRARFTLAHYTDKGFKGGFFSQFDGTYNRGCAELDYTPATLDEVIKRFLAWCNSGYKFPTKEVRIDKRAQTHREPRRQG
jgi:hypothetical protein